MDTNKPNICVDFDGVIHRYSRGWQGGMIYDDPMPGALESLKSLSTKYNVVIFTTRLNPTLREDGIAKYEKELINWLEKYGFKQGIHYTELTAIKPKAKLYLDDRGLRFENWNQAVKDIDNILG